MIDARFKPSDFLHQGVRLPTIKQDRQTIRPFVQSNRPVRNQNSRLLHHGSRLWLALLLWLVLSAGVILVVSLILIPSANIDPSPVSEADQRSSSSLPRQAQTVLIGPSVASESPVASSVASGNSQPDGFASPPQAFDLASSSQLSTSSQPLPGQIIPEVPRHPQERNLNCELRSTTDLAAFYGWDFTWETLFSVVGHDPGGDPNKGFVGRSMNDPVGGIYPAGYGVHADPVARGLRRLGIPATAHHGVDSAWLRDQIDDGRPVIIWATYGMLPQEIVYWTTEDGETVAGVRFEHTFTVVGYDHTGVWVNDPWDASQRQYSWPDVERSWSLLGNMALTIDEH